MSSNRKPSRNERLKIDRKNLEQENKRKAESDLANTRVYNCRNKSKELTSVEKQRAKESCKKSRADANMRTGKKINLRAESTIYGDYFLIDFVPIFDMSFLLINFKTRQFRKTYKDQKSEIWSCNPKMQKEEYTSYWILDANKGSEVSRSGNWLDNNHVTESQDISLQNFLTRVSIALKDELKLEEEKHFETMLPGFVETGVASHQGLHLDRRDVNLNKPSLSYILHLPLDTEGLQLRLGKLDEKSELKHSLIRVPFGSAILLPLTQLHAGHYGRHGNFRFHAIFSELAWHKSYLMSLEDYLEERNEGNPKKVDVRAIVDKFEREILHTDADVMKNFTRDQKYKYGTYLKNLKQFNPSSAFLSLLAENTN